jgi:Phage integrase family
MTTHLDPSLHLLPERPTHAPDLAGATRDDSPRVAGPVPITVWRLDDRDDGESATEPGAGFASRLARRLVGFYIRHGETIIDVDHDHHSTVRRPRPAVVTRRSPTPRSYPARTRSESRSACSLCGTLVYVKGKGFFRQEWTKNDAGYRMIVLPRFAVGMLLARKLVGTWLSPNNVRRQWRQARAETNLEWVTPHTFRKTVATLIDKEADTKSAAAQLGHASEEITDKYYIAKPVLAPDVSEILEQLGAAGVAEDDRVLGRRGRKRAA